MTGPRYDAFLSHHSPDKPAVEALGKRLDAEGISCWLDKWNLIPGDEWQPAVEAALGDCACCVVFFGPERVGPWQNEEMRAAIARRVRQQPGTYRVLPVLLPGARRADRSPLPEFLQGTTWVEFADTLDDPDAFHRLVCGIRRIPPGIGSQAVALSNDDPYRGLEPFLEQHARFFFGREAQVQVLLDKLRDGLQKPDAMRFLAIVGASGSGKSSLAQAGLIPALRRGRHRGSSQWPVVVLRPGARPLESLAVALAGDPHLGAAVRDPLDLCDQLARDPRRLHMTVLQALRSTADSHRAVLVVDQFEETFTLCPDEDAASRAAFFDNLLHAGTVYGGRTVVVLTMRADFWPLRKPTACRP